MKFVRSFSPLAASILMIGMADTSLAQTEPRGFYATVYAQASNLGSTTFDEVGSAGFGSGLTSRFGNGLGLGGDIGFRYGNGWASELEWNWRRVVTIDGRRWAIHSVVYDEAGPELIRLIAENEPETGRTEAVLLLDIHAWCEMCARHGLPARALLRR